MREKQGLKQDEFLRHFGEASMMNHAHPHGLDEWKPTWSSPFHTIAYEPLYLANGTFGGMLDLSGSTLDLWSSQIGAIPGGSDHPPGVLYPLTALRTRVFYRNAYYSTAQAWIGATGIHTTDPRYTSTDGIPHIPQIYECRQELDLQNGVATTSGKLFLGTQAALEAGFSPERVIPFETRVVFLKGSRGLGIEVNAAPDTEILFSPDFVLEERFILDVSDRGIARIGTDEIKCDFQFQKTISEVSAQNAQLIYLVRPDGGVPYRVIITAEAGTVTTFAGEPALAGRGRVAFFVEIHPGETESDPVLSLAPSSFAELLAEQQKRWAAFWSASDLRLPEHEALWQQRYRTSLYYVAQSMGNGPTHPGGLSRPMFPYWYGCFHDTDTYFCRALLDTGHFDEAALHLAYRHRGLPIARDVARRAGRSGALYPWQTDVNGNGTTHDVPVNGAILACEAWHHYLHTGRAEALAQSHEILAETLANLADHLDLTAEPLRFQGKSIMTFSETMVAEDPIEARVALRSVAAAYLAASTSKGETNPTLAPLANRILADLTVPVVADGSYAIGSDGDPEYQRTPSVILGSFPLHHLKASEALEHTFDKELSRILLLFAWLPHQASVVASQIRRAEGPTSAIALLRQADVFLKPWHAGDEWENRRSVRAAVFVTGAGGFCIALHHAVLAETEDQVWTLFPGIPAEWKDLAFDDLTTRAGWKVSARLANGKIVSLRAEPTHAAASAVFTLDVARLHPSLLAAAGLESEEESKLLRLSHPLVLNFAG
ncbi:MAG TPA: hypothetical protein VF585_02210 [Chthoniobacterales bacterium]